MTDKTNKIRMGAIVLIIIGMIANFNKWFIGSGVLIALLSPHIDLWTSKVEGEEK